MDITWRFWRRAKKQLQGNPKKVVDPKKDTIKTQLLCDIFMMVLLGGKEREENELAQLIKQAGFGSYKIYPILGLRSLIEIYP